MKKNERQEYVEMNIGKIAVMTVLGIILLVIVLGSFYTVNAGERVVLLTWGKPSMDAVGEGLHWKFPIAQSAKVMNVKTVKLDQLADAASKDLQDVQMTVSVNYHLSPSLTPRLYQEVGKSYEDTVIIPAVQDAVKSTSATFNAEDQLVSRPEMGRLMKADLTKRLAEFHIIVDAVNIVNLQFSEQFDAAIEAKQVAEQNAQKAENELIQVKLEAEQAIAMSRAEAEALRLQKNEITPELLQLRAIEVEMVKWERWDGALPTTTLGGSSGVLPFYNVNGASVA